MGQAGGAGRLRRPPADRPGEADRRGGDVRPPAAFRGHAAGDGVRGQRDRPGHRAERAEDEIRRLNEHLNRRLRRIKALRRSTWPSRPAVTWVGPSLSSSSRRSTNSESIRPTPALRRGDRDAGVRRRSGDPSDALGAVETGPGRPGPSGRPGGLAALRPRPGPCPGHGPASPAPGGGFRGLPRRPADGQGPGQGVLECFGRADGARRGVARPCWDAGRAGRHRHRQRRAVRGSAPIQ